MRRVFLTLALAILTLCTYAQEDLTTLFEKSGGTETPPYHEVIAYFQKAQRGLS